VNIRIALIGTALAAGTVFLASSASARAIRTDTGNINSCAPNAVQLTFSPGLTGTPDACILFPSDDQELGIGPFEADSTTVYSWDGGNTNNWSNSVQLVVYSLDGNDGNGDPTSTVASGDTEFAFNYLGGNNLSTCLVNPPALSSTPALTFDGKTYQFTGANGAGICDAASTSDFVFSPTSYVGWIDDNSTLETSRLPPGWAVAATSAPEPDSFALILIAGSLAAAFAFLRRRRASR
jgi:hypothetical protein